MSQLQSGSARDWVTDTLYL